MKISKSESYLKIQEQKYIDVNHLRNYYHYYFSVKHEVKQVLIIVTQ